MQPGDHRPRRRVGIFDGINQQQARLNRRSERGLGGYESSLESSSDGGNDDVVPDGFPDGRDPKRASDVASSSSLVPLVSPGRSDCQWAWSVSLRGFMLGELAGRDRAESPEVFWDGETDIGPEYDANWGV